MGCAAGAAPSEDPAEGVWARAIDPEIQRAEIVTRSAVGRARRSRRTDSGEHMIDDYRRNTLKNG